MTSLKLRAIGNSVGVLLPKRLLAQLGVGKGDRLHVVKTERGIELRPYDSVFEGQMDVGEVAITHDRDASKHLRSGDD